MKQMKSVDDLRWTLFEEEAVWMVSKTTLRMTALRVQ
jgi:hypothetical protein